MKFYTKIYRVENEIIVAACDKDLCGKILEDGELILKITEEFYGGEIVGEEEMRHHLSTATIANLVGNNIVKLAIEEGIIDSENVLKIKGVSHAQMAIM
jgi:hypothetical protein